jgi:hypothetical protein
VAPEPVRAELVVEVDVEGTSATPVLISNVDTKGADKDTARLEKGAQDKRSPVAKTAPTQQRKEGTTSTRRKDVAVRKTDAYGQGSRRMATASGTAGPAAEVPCRNFNNGHCAFGDKCNFLHGVGPTSGQRRFREKTIAGQERESKGGRSEKTKVDQERASWDREKSSKYYDDVAKGEAEAGADDLKAKNGVVEPPLVEAKKPKDADVTTVPSVLTVEAGVNIESAFSALAEEQDEESEEDEVHYY